MGKCKQSCVKTYGPNPVPVIYITDLTNFDDTIALMLLAKDPNVRLLLVVVNLGFNNVGPSINNTFNILDWLRNTTTQVIAGSYFAPQEIAAGPNPDFGTFDPVRVGQVAQPIFHMFVPPLWQENGSTLYGTVGQIPLNNDPSRQYQAVAGNIQPYVPPEDQVRNVILEAGEPVVIINTGPLTVLNQYLNKYLATQGSQIRNIYIMGGGFFNANGTQLWAGNIFSDQAFLPPGDFPPPLGYQFRPGDWEQRVPFTTMQEFNIFLDPLSAQGVFDKLETAPFQTYLIPTDATDPAFIGAGTVAQLDNSCTWEARYVANLFRGIENFEGGSFALDVVIRLWDIVATLVFLQPELIQNVIKADVTVEQVDVSALQLAKCTNPLLNPYNVLQFNPYVGQTTLVPAPTSNLNVVLEVNVDAARQSMIDRLKACLNRACEPLNY